MVQQFYNVHGKNFQNVDSKWIKVVGVNMGFAHHMETRPYQNFEDLEAMSTLPGVKAIVVNEFTNQAYLRGSTSVVDLDDSEEDSNMTTYLLKTSKFRVAV